MAALKLITSSKSSNCRISHGTMAPRVAIVQPLVCWAGCVEAGHVKAKAPTVASHRTTAQHAAIVRPFLKLRWLR
eukprot:12413759-Karenia_brevis.AAC.1